MRASVVPATLSPATTPVPACAHKALTLRAGTRFAKFPPVGKRRAQCMASERRGRMVHTFVCAWGCRVPPEPSCPVRQLNAETWACNRNCRGLVVGAKLVVECCACHWLAQPALKDGDKRQSLNSARMCGPPMSTMAQPLVAGSTALPNPQIQPGPMRKLTYIRCCKAAPRP